MSTSYEDQTLELFCSTYQDALNHDPAGAALLATYETQTTARSERWGLIAPGTTVRLVRFTGQILAAHWLDRDLILRTRTEILQKQWLP